MHTNLKKIKAAILSGMVAAVSVASSLSTAVAPSQTATAADGDNYAKLLQYSLYFYDANMCGSDVTSKGGLSWRSNCHTSDEVDGGFHDAGDHVMFGVPQGYSAAILGWSYYEFKDAYEATGQAEHLKVITDKFAKFFRDATVLNGDSVSKLCIEKGDGNVDHSYWGAPETQGNRGGVKWATGGCANVAAEYAAALAANYVNFGNADDLKYAKALFNFAKRDPSPYSCEFYGSGESGTADEIAWAACWLYLATKDNTYMSDVNNAPDAWWVMNWENIALGAAILKGEITGDWGAAHELDKFTGDGYKFYNKWGSARYNANAQFCSLVAAKHGKGNASWAKGQMEYLTGDKAFANGQKHCLVVGFKSDASKEPHHRAASGTNSAETDGTPSAHVLVGALCGGPLDESGTYYDKRSDYVGNEVALDYNAGFVGAAAGLYSNYKSGSVDKSIEGVTKIYPTGGSSSTTPSQPQQTTAPSQPQQTTAPVQTNPPVQRTTAPSNPGGQSSSNGDYIEYKANQRIVYKELPEDDKMIGWAWKDIGVTSKDKISKVEICISSNNGNIGKWQGAFGSSTKISPDYWTQTKDMQETISGTSGVITWDIPSSTASDIQTEYGGELKWGIWWVDCGDITVDSIKVYTGSGSSSSVNTTPRTTAPVQTNPPVQRTTAPSNPGGQSSSNGDYIEYKPNQRIVYKELPEDDKMIGWAWKDIGVTSKDKISKVEICISSNNGNIGKWQGAFGSSTKISPDYWTQTKDMQETISGTSGVITWDIPSSTASDIQTEYGGELKWGIWWVDCGDITVDSIKVYTGSGSSSSSNDTPRTSAPTTVRTTQTTTQRPTQPVVTTVAPSNDVKVSKWGDANCDGKVSLGDSLAILQFIVNSDKYPMTAQGQANADVSNNGDGLTSMDSFVIQQVVTELITENDLPVSYMNR